MQSIKEILLSKSRPEAEGFIQSKTRSAYLGNDRILCSILGDYKLFVLGTDTGFAPHMIFDGYWEYWLTKFMAENIKPGDTVLDVGANVGYYSILMSELVGPEGKVVAVEPNPILFRLLNDSLAINGFARRSVSHNIALSGLTTSDEETFFVPFGEFKNGRLLLKGENEDTLKEHGELVKVKVQNFPVDSIESLDFIKIDVEGAELKVIEALKDSINKHKPKVICECNFARGYTYNDVKAMFEVDGDLDYLDFDGTIQALTPEKIETERVGDDWLVYWDYKQ